VIKEKPADYCHKKITSKQDVRFSHKCSCRQFVPSRVGFVKWEETFASLGNLVFVDGGLNNRLKIKSGEPSSTNSAKNSLFEPVVDNDNACETDTGFKNA
jgi:hypothetical protein